MFTFKKHSKYYNIGIFISMLESSHGWNTQLIKAVKDNNTLKTRVLITQSWNNKYNIYIYLTWILNKLFFYEK